MRRKSNSAPSDSEEQGGDERCMGLHSNDTAGICCASARIGESSSMCVGVCLHVLYSLLGTFNRQFRCSGKGFSTEPLHPSDAG